MTTIIGDRLSYDKNTKLGEGRFGIVFVGYYMDDDNDGMKVTKQVAVKRFRLASSATGPSSSFDREKEILQKAIHPNILCYVCSVMNDTFIFLATERCQATLENYVEGPYQGPRFQSEKVILCEVTQGLAHLHKLKIIHRDIKPTNILIFAPSSDNDEGIIIKPQIKLADFGISKILEKNKIDCTNSSKTNPTGSRGWMAPEVYESNRFNFKVDVWALGLVFFYTLSDGNHPFGDDQDERTVRIKRKEPMLLTETDLIESINVRKAFELIKLMLTVEPENRPTVTDILKHSFLRDEVIKNKKKEEMEERKRINVIVEGLILKFQKQHTKMEECQKTMQLIKKHSAQMKANKDFKYDVTLSKGTKVAMSDGNYTNNCSKCSMACHFPCAENQQKCFAMDSNGFCTTCPKKCKWDLHLKQNYHWVFQDVTETRTYDDIKKKYEGALKKKLSTEDVLQDLQAELDQINFDLKSDINTITACLQRLDSISLHPDAFTSTEYLELMIQVEMEEKEPGFQRRVKSLTSLLDKVRVVQKIRAGEFNCP